eukprot:TRINITY_DN5332_c1_g2_i1.p1 TRINITY_DN5332_c1_g2~~TRINITY_DN5332_c1_g2_i1.p1  ORF type:complete len:579 (+),score=145.95 TRINITY_DN5332_c1_g2_i1:79-1737(+)
MQPAAGSPTAARARAGAAPSGPAQPPPTPRNPQHTGRGPPHRKGAALAVITASLLVTSSALYTSGSAAWRAAAPAPRPAAPQRTPAPAPLLPPTPQPAPDTPAPTDAGVVVFEVGDQVRLLRRREWWDGRVLEVGAKGYVRRVAGGLPSVVAVQGLSFDAAEGDVEIAGEGMPAAARLRRPRPPPLLPNRSAAGGPSGQGGGLQPPPAPARTPPPNISTPVPPMAAGQRCRRVGRRTVCFSIEEEPAPETPAPPPPPPLPTPSPPPPPPTPDPCDPGDSVRYPHGPAAANGTPPCESHPLCCTGPCAEARRELLLGMQRDEAAEASAVDAVLQLLRRKAEPYRGTREVAVLELGVAHGAVLRALLHQLPSGVTVHGTDDFAPRDGAAAGGEHRELSASCSFAENEGACQGPQGCVWQGSACAAAPWATGGLGGRRFGETPEAAAAAARRAVAYELGSKGSQGCRLRLHRYAPLNAAEHFDTGSLDAVILATTDVDELTRLAQTWLPRLRSKGLMIFRKYDDPQVTRAARRFARSAHLPLARAGDAAAYLTTR